MCLYYASQIPEVVIGTKAGTTRTSISLTDAYDVANKTKIIETGGFSKLSLNVLYTMGATETANSIEVRLDVSTDGVNFYRIANEAKTAGATTATAEEYSFVGADAAAATISIFKDIAYKYIRVSVKETGKVTNFGTVFVEALLSGK